MSSKTDEWFINSTTYWKDDPVAWEIVHGVNDMRDGPAGSVCVVKSSYEDAIEIVKLHNENLGRKA